jgi:hypothetical protein
MLLQNCCEGKSGLRHYYNFSYIKLQAVVGIPFSLPQNVLILVSVSAYTGLSRFGFASRSGETRHACHAIIYYIDNKKNFDATPGGEIQV